MMQTVVMNKKYTRVLLILATLGLIGVISLAVFYLRTHNIAVLNPKGTIASSQQRLIILATSLMAIVVIPVFILTFAIAWRYRESNTKAKYSPELAGNRWTEAIWWIVPFAIISVLAVVAWTSSHDLDPYKPITSSAPPVNIQVVALQWKWLFIYPDRHIATVNFIELPKDTPVNFEITADAPMNSFWIPQLGGQVYAMPGMSTQLHLMGSELGDYRGSSANISGSGFSGMNFTARVSAANDFNSWVQQTQKSPQSLTLASYNGLAKPSKNVVPTYYSFPSSSTGLYDTVVMKYMAPTVQN